MAQTTLEKTIYYFVIMLFLVVIVVSLYYSFTSSKTPPLPPPKLTAYRSSFFGAAAPGDAPSINGSLKLTDQFVTNVFNDLVAPTLKPYSISDGSYVISVKKATLKFDINSLTLDGDANVDITYKKTKYPLVTTFRIITGITVPDTVLGYLTGLNFTVNSAKFTVSDTKSKVQKAMATVFEGLLNAAVWTGLKIKSTFTLPILSLIGVPADIAIKNGSVQISPGEMIIGMQSLEKKKSDVGLSCSSGDACSSGGCGFANMDTKEKTCCAGGTANYLFKPYCTGHAIGEKCYIDKVCSSNYCKGNLSGMRAGTCQEKAKK